MNGLPAWDQAIERFQEGNKLGVHTARLAPFDHVAFDVLPFADGPCSEPFGHFTGERHSERVTDPPGWRGRMSSRSEAIARAGRSQRGVSRSEAGLLSDGGGSGCSGISGW
jgi:hypothetical protein